MNGNTNFKVTGSKQRIEWLDIARGIAMISIVLGHLNLWSINKVVYTYDLPVFFIISGYFLDQTTSYKNFLKKKVRSLLVPYYFCCACICILSVIFSIFQHQNAGSNIINWLYAAVYAAGDSYKKPFYIQGIGALWFLWATFWGEIILRATLNANVKWLAPVCTIFYFLFGILTYKYIWLPLSFQAGGGAILYMYIGHILKKYNKYIKAFEKKIPQLILTILAFIGWLYFIKTFSAFWLVHCEIGKPYNIFGSLCACYLLMQVSRLISYLNIDLRRILIFTGKYSLLFLSLHIIELNLFPWKSLIYTFSPELAAKSYHLTLVGAKFLFIYIMMFVLIRIPLIQKIFNYSHISNIPSFINIRTDDRHSV